MKNVKKRKERSGFREFLWNYPALFSKLVLATAPISYGLIFGIFGFLLFFAVYSGSMDGYIVNARKDVIVEGTVGKLSSYNPIFVPQTQVDRDIWALMYQKFIAIKQDGTPLPEIASSWKRTSDGKGYTFTISDDIYWQDGVKLTADDVVYTFQTAITLASKYSKDTVGQALEGITVRKVTDTSVRINFAEENSTFFESIAIYIVPKHLLNDTSLATYEDSLFEEFPIGSGPYKLYSSDENSIILLANEYFKQEVNIKRYEYMIYPEVEDLEIAFRNGKLDLVSGLSLSQIPFVVEYAKNFDVLQSALEYRKKMIFINTRESAFANVALRNGLSYVIDRKGLLDLTGIDGKVSKSSFAESSWAFDPSLSYPKYELSKAEGFLKSAGYVKDGKSGFFENSDGKILTLKLTYLNNDINEVLAKGLKDILEKGGIILELDGQNYERLTNETIATRDFDLLLYEIEITVDPDQYNLWHSLRASYPNLNLSGYSNDRVDFLLERGREASSRTERKLSYLAFMTYLNLETPAIFLYEPKWNYVVSNRVEGIDLSNVKFPADRFSNVGEWKIVD